MQSLISVIVPIYNVECYLNKCIESIIRQTYFNIEIILVDDGSTDGCPEICDQYMKKDSRIKVIHKKNGGLSDARNAGLDLANGDYYVFVDSDDYIEENMIEVLYKRAVFDKVKLVLCNYYNVNDEGIANMAYEVRDSVLTQDGFWHLKYSIGFGVVAWNKIYHKSLFEKVRFKFGKLNEDAFILHEIIEQCDRISLVSNCLYYYVQRNNSIMGNKYNVRRLDNVEASLIRSDYFWGKNKFYFSLLSDLCALYELANSYTKLDFSIETNKIRFQELKKRLRENVKRNKSNLSFKNKIGFKLFFVNEKIYLTLKNLKN